MYRLARHCCWRLQAFWDLISLPYEHQISLAPQIKFEINLSHSLKFGFAFRSNSSPSPFHRYPFCDQQRVYSVSFDAFRLSVSARSSRSLRLSRCIYFSPGFTPNIEKLNFGGIENFEAINAQKFRNPNLEGLDRRNFINLIN
ncbi:hypothetical protein ACFX13_026623 [Malus domestica]